MSAITFAAIILNLVAIVAHVILSIRTNPRAAEFYIALHTACAATLVVAIYSTQ